MKAWLKGGLIGGVLWIMLFLINIRGWNQMMSVMKVPITDIILMFIFYLIIFFLIGMLVGGVVGLIITKSKSKPRKTRR